MTLTLDDHPALRASECLPQPRTCPVLAQHSFHPVKVLDLVQRIRAVNPMVPTPV